MVVIITSIIATIFSTMLALRDAHKKDICGTMFSCTAMICSVILFATSIAVAIIMKGTGVI